MSSVAVIDPPPVILKDVKPSVTPLDIGLPMASVKNVGIKYERRVGRWKYEKYWALKNVSFDIHQGDTVGIVGRNGAGKSTLLRLLAGIYKPDKGTLVRHYRYTASLIALNVGFVADLSGRENVVLGAMLLGLTRQEAYAIIEDVKKQSGLKDFFEQPIITYSTGMKARLGFWVAYYANPDMILMDEALGGVGDKDFADKTQEAIDKKFKQESKTLIIASHGLHLLRKLCNKVVWIEKGIVFEAGDPDFVIDSYIAYKSR